MCVCVCVCVFVCVYGSNKEDHWKKRGRGALPLVSNASSNCNPLEYQLPLPLKA